MVVGVVPTISLYTFSQSDIDKLAQALCKAGALSLSDCTPSALPLALASLPPAAAVWCARVSSCFLNLCALNCVLVVEATSNFANVHFVLAIFKRDSSDSGLDIEQQELQPSPQRRLDMSMRLSSQGNLLCQASLFLIQRHLPHSYRFLSGRWFAHSIKCSASEVHPKP